MAQSPRSSPEDVQPHGIVFRRCILENAQSLGLPHTDPPRKAYRPMTRYFAALAPQMYRLSMACPRP